MGLLFKKPNTFIESSGAEVLPVKEKKSTLRAPSRVKIYDPSKGLTAIDLNVALMGIQGSGKTYAVVAMLLKGYRVFIINTDAGATGIETIIAELRKAKREELLMNLRAITLFSYDDFSDFCETPTKFYEDFYSFAPQILYWEGFSNFQQNYISEKTSELYVDGAKDIKEIREGGFKFEQQDWGVIRNATGRALDDFLAIRVPEINLLRIISLHEAISSRQIKDASGQTQTVEELSKRPFIQGASKNLFSQAFCLVLRTVKKKKVFTYENIDDALGFTKNRSIDLPDSMEADFGRVMEQIESAYGIKIG